MKLLLSTPAKSLNKAYLKQSLKRDQIDLFRANLARMFERIRTDEHEEHLKNIVSDFLKDTWYKQTHEINTSGRTDLVIHNGTSSNDNVGVLLEVKRPGNSAEMISHEKPNSKALHELLHYYMQERYLKGNLEVRRLIVCNIYEWYIFDAADFERLFFQNKKFVESYQKWSNGLFSGDKTDWLYKEILKPFVEGELENLTCTYFNLKEYERIVRNPARAEDNKLITLYKVLSPPHLLKQTFANDSNSLNREFYSELLHIIGLEEVKEKGKKLIQRKPEGKRDDGSLLENTCNILKTRGRLSALANPQQYGADADEQYFSVALELCITWLNRLLFLKLLEGQLITYHKGDRSHAFLGSSKIDDFDELNELFFEVLAVRVDERSESVRAKFGTIPYLNSSLFEESDLERATIRINELKNRLDLPLSSSTVLKASNGKRLTGSKNTLNYLFEFLDAYDFGAEGSAEIQEQNKSIINASVLGLIFEKINGYRDGSFFTPGFITMYICRETIRQAVLRKFNDTYGWSCADLTELHNEIYRQRLPLKETNALVNSLKICDPAVGSGHFLVSALNELIAIKNTLGILADRDGKLLRCDLTIENDELIVTIDDQIFEYRYKDSESQRINGKDFTRYSFVSSPKMYLKYGQWLAEPREIAPFFKSKIILRQTADSIIAVLDETKSINLNNVYNIGVSDPRYDLRYILALLNSKLINIYYQSISQEKGRLFAEVKKVYLEQIPIKIIDNQIQEPIITLANKILAVKQADHKADISTLEAEIDQLVYALYNLTDEEIALVEGKA